MPVATHTYLLLPRPACSRKQGCIRQLYRLQRSDIILIHHQTPVCLQCEPSGAVSRAFEKLLWGSQSVQQLQQNIQQAAPSMGPPHAALAFAAAAELLDRSSSSSGAHRDNMSQQLIGTLANIWQRQLDKASPADMLVALCAWSRLGIAQEQQAWASTVDAFTRNCQGASQRDIGRVATAIAAAAADAGNSAAVTTAVDALAAMFERFAAQDTVHVPALAKLITAYEILGVSLPALLQALVQQHEQSLVAYEQKQLLYQITGSCSLQQLEDILKQFGSTLGAANVAAAATKVAKMVAAEPSQRAAGRRLLSQGVANVWSQKLAAAASGDIARVLVACTEIGCYGNPVLSGGSLSALLLQLQKLDSKQAAQCEGQSVDALIQKQQQQNQHQQQQGRQTTRLGIRALNSVLFFIGQCGKHHGSIPGLSAGDVAQLLDALSQQVALHLQYDAVNKHWKGLGSVGVSMLMMARAAVQAPSSSGELTTLLNSLVVVVQLQPIEGKHVARIMHALGRLQHDCPWQPRLDGVLWQQLLSPAQVEQIASTSPKHVANTVGALALLATNVPVWGVNVDYAASISKQLACTVVRQLLVGRVARELGGWNTLDVRTVLSACLTLDVRVEPFLQQLHATALIKKWGKNIESLLQQLAATDELALTEKTMIKSCQQQAQLFT